MIHVLCDEIDSGKSTYVLGLSASLVKRNKKISGFITPSHIEGGKKAGHDFIAIKNGKFLERIPFTRLKKFDNAFKWRRFYFNSEAFDIARTLNTNCDLFIMDEIGPLELEDKKGFYDVMNAAFTNSKNILVVVRKGLEDNAILRRFTRRKKCFKLPYFSLANKIII